MWIFPNLPKNVDKIPNSKGPGPRTKKVVTALHAVFFFIMFLLLRRLTKLTISRGKWIGRECLLGHGDTNVAKLESELGTFTIYTASILIGFGPYYSQTCLMWLFKGGKK